MGVYEPLANHLKSLSRDSWSASFSEIERILSRKLPDSAYDYRPWWGNQKKGNHSQAKAWREAGWETRDVNLEHKVVRFERVGTEVNTKPEGSRVSELEELWTKAERVMETSDRDTLLKSALRALINREAAKYFAQLGGTMPDFEPAPRERPFG
jgi:hypothetical protein